MTQRLLFPTTCPRCRGEMRVMPTGSHGCSSCAYLMRNTRLPADALPDDDKPPPGITRQRGDT